MLTKYDTALEDLLCWILDCDSKNLELLRCFGYDWDEIFIHMNWKQGTPCNLQGLINAEIDLGLDDMNLYIQKRIYDLTSRLLSGDINEDDRQELCDLRLLNPKYDFVSNYQNNDVTILCKQNQEIYLQYLQKGIEVFERETGFAVTFE